MKSTEGFLQSQPLWKEEQFKLKQFRFPDCSGITNTGFELPTNLRLGHQVEQIFKYLIDSHPDYEVLGHSIQIKKGNTTKGELDFLVRFRESVYHIELSYKFYIIDPVISEPIHRLMGPNRRDMFFTKLEKTKNQQLPLLYSELCKPVFKDLKLDVSQIKQQVCFLGQLFIPVNSRPPSIRPLNKKCIVGYWMKMSEFEKPIYDTSEYYIPLKYEWIHVPHHEVKWQSHFEILMEVTIKHLQKNAPMLWRKLPDGTIDKFFVVWW